MNTRTLWILVSIYTCCLLCSCNSSVNYTYQISIDTENNDEQSLSEQLEWKNSESEGTTEYETAEHPDIDDNIQINIPQTGFTQSVPEAYKQTAEKQG